MPREDRSILFDYREVYKALYALHLKKHEERLPAGEILRVLEDDGDKDVLYFHMAGSNGGEGHTLEFSRDFLAAALLLFCRGMGIPVSKNAKKDISFDNEVGDITLKLRIGVH